MGFGVLTSSLYGDIVAPCWNRCFLLLYLFGWRIFYGCGLVGAAVTDYHLRFQENRYAIFNQERRISSTLIRSSGIRL